MFNVTYEIVTEESAEQGDFEETGFVMEKASLREAFEAVFETRTAHCSGITGIDANCYPINPHFVSWFTVDNGMEFLTGARESRSFHFPDNLTASTKARILRLAGITPTPV